MVGQSVQFLFKEGTAADWITKNPILASGEPGYENDTGKLKLGDGHTNWTSLKYFVPLGTIDPGDDSPAMQALLVHIESLTPHTVYDDGPSLVLLYENAKV